MGIRIGTNHPFFFVGGLLVFKAGVRGLSVIIKVVFQVIAQNNSICNKGHIDQRLEQTRNVPEKHHVLIIFNPKAFMLRVPNLQLTVVCVQGAIKLGRRTRRGSKLFSFKVFISKRSIRNITFLLDVYALILLCVFLERDAGSCPKAGLLFLDRPPLFLHPLPSLISNYLNLSLETQKRSWWLKEAHFLRTRNGGHRKAFVPLSPTGACSGFSITYLEDRQARMEQCM